MCVHRITYLFFLSCFYSLSPDCIIKTIGKEYLSFGKIIFAIYNKGGIFEP